MLVCVLVLLSTIHAITGQCISNNLRLQQTATLTALNSGRLEICRNGIWGSIQASSSISFWSEKNVLVACRQLGFNGGLNSVPPNQLIPADQMNAGSPVHYSNVVCDGMETNITECRSDAASGTSNHNSDVYVVCLPGSITYTDLHTTTTSSVGDVRLVGSTSNGRGAVEILSIIGWSTICPDSNWEDSDASAICQNLGYDSGRTENFFVDSPVISPRFLHDSECISSIETRSDSFGRIQAGDCTFLSFNNDNDCPFVSNIFAGVTCSTSNSEGSVRMIAGGELSNSGRRQGVVEVLYDGRWGVLCRPVDETEVAQSICEGFGHERDDASVLSISTQELQNIESRLKPLWIPNIACTSSSQGLLECSLGSPLGYGTCASRNGDILAVDCGNISSNSGGLSGGTTAAIIVAVIITVVVVGSFFYGKDKNRYKTWFRSTTTTTNIATAARTTPAVARTTPAAATSITVATSSDIRVVEDVPPEPENPELTKAPPPSYQAAFDLPSPGELPPPYSNPSAPPRQDNPPPESNPAYPSNPSYPPPGSNPSYPPPGSNLPYPPPGSNPSYPPPGSNLPYPPPGSVYPPPGGDPAYPPLAYPPQQAYPPPTNTPYPS